jgi:hypothetical protein
VLSRFSPQLIEKMAKYFREKHGVDISLDTAEEYLGSLSEVFLVHARLSEVDGERARDKVEGEKKEAKVFHG